MRKLRIELAMVSLFLLLAVSMPAVSGMSFENMELVANTTSDANGNFTFTDVPNGNYTLASVIWSSSMSGMWLTNATELVITDGNATEVNFAMRKNTSNDHEVILSYLDRTTISGRTVSKSGSAKVGTDLILLDGQGNFVSNTTSDSNGNFTFTDVRNGNYTLSGVIWSSSMSGMWLTNTTDLTIINGTAADVTFSMRKNTSNDHEAFLSYLDRTTISGRTVSKSGSAKVDTDLILLDDDGEFVANTTSDSSGNFTFTDVRNGNYTLSGVIWSSSMSGMWLTNTTDLTITNGTAADVTFAMRKNTSNDHEAFLSYLDRTTISGRTVSKSGSAKVGTDLVLLKALPEEEVETSEEPQTRIEIRAIKTLEFFANTTSDANGNFTFTDVPNGNYTLSGVIWSSSMSGMWLTNTTDLTISNGTAADVTFAMRKNTSNDHEAFLSYLDRTTISGRTVSKSGSAKVGTDLILLEEDGDFVANTTSDSNGNFTFTDVSNGNYTLSGVIWSSSMSGMWLTNTTDLTITNGTAADVTFAMRKNTSNDHEAFLSYLDRTTISGRTVSKSGSAKVGTDLILLDGDGDFVANTTSDSNGNFTFTDVPNGNYTLSGVIWSSAMTGMWLTNTTDLTITNGTAADVTFSMRKNTSNDHEAFLSYLDRTTISGRTVSKSGSAKAGTDLILLRKRVIATTTSVMPSIPVSNAPHLNVAFVTGYATYEVPMQNFVARINGNSSLNMTATAVVSSNLNESVDLSQMDIIYVNMFTQSASKLEETVDEAISNGAVVIGYNTYLNESSYAIPRPLTKDDFLSLLQDYWLNGAADESNFDNMMFYLANLYYDRNDLDIIDPIGPPSAAIYHPNMTATSYRYFTDNASEYFQWYSTRTDGHQFDPERPTVGITFYKSYYPLQMATFNELIYRLEDRNINVIAGYGSSGHPHDDLLFHSNETKVDLILSVNYRGIYFNATEMDVPVINTVLNGYMDYNTWQNVSNPLPETNMLRLYRPETEGAIDPIMIAAEEVDERTNGDVYVPVDSQVEWLLDRSVKQTELSGLNESDKKVAIIYYNHGGGKDNIGASYLEVTPSICNLLSGMETAGYDVNTSLIPDKNALVDMMLHQGRNVGTWAPGELESMVESGNLTLIPEATYKSWFDALPQQRKDEVIEIWGKPPGEVMVYENESGEYLVIPKISVGENVILAPQPTRGWLQDNELLYHDSELPPHHQYIAFYLWLQNDFNANAVVNMGRHGTVEWLPGRQFCLMADEWPALMAGDIPVIYPYVMDGMGEGYQAKRRGNAVIVDHLIPPVVESGSYGEYTTLSEKISDYNTNKNHLTEDLKESHRNEIVNLTIDLGIDADVNMSLGYSNTTFDMFTDEVNDRLEELRSLSMPYGLHVLGEAPQGDELVGMVKSMLGSPYVNEVSRFNTSFNASSDLLRLVLLQNQTPASAQAMLLNNSSAALTDHLDTSLEYRAALMETDNEVNQVLKALDGRFIEPNKGGDPISDPSALPSGRNFYAFDEMELPTVASWTLGKRLAQDMLNDYRSNHNGSYPNKVAYILWAGESTRNECVMESQILYLMGVQPVWEKGKVVDVVHMNDTEMAGRPRIDVVVQISGLYRDTFPMKVNLLDRAVRCAYEQNGTNYVRENTDNLTTLLNSSLGNATLSRQIAMFRVFGPADGMYGTGMENAVSASETWENRSELAELYLSRMSNPYGEFIWGESVSEFIERNSGNASVVNNTYLFANNLKGTRVTMHSRSSNVYGAMDTNDFYQYLGGLNNAIELLSGEGPESYITNLQDPNDMKIETLSAFISNELYSRYFNPKWILGMQESGYEGARQMEKFFENLWGWEALCPDVISNSMWDKAYKTYYTTEMTDWMKANNPYAYQAMTARLLETARKGAWDPSEETLARLASDYQRSVVEDGVTCCHHTCGNPLLDDYVRGKASVAGYAKVMEDATGRKLTSSSSSGSTGEAQVVESQSGNQTQSMNVDAGYGMQTDQPAPEMDSTPDNYVEGYEMVKEQSESDESSGMSFSGSDILGSAVVLLAVGAMYLGFRRKGI